jgi:hypothetical protein
MDCLLHLATALCLVSPSQLTIRADLSSQVGGDIHYVNAGIDYHGGTVGHVAIEMPLAIYRNFTLTGGLHHFSLIDTTRDRGEERFAVGFVYRPFGGAR